MNTIELRRREKLGKTCFLIFIIEFKNKKELDATGFESISSHFF
jgi:hypothetical protein